MRLRLPQTRTSTLIGAAIFGVVIVVGVIIAVTQPANRAWALIGTPVLCLIFAGMLATRTVLDADHGSITTTRVWVFRRRVDLASATRIAIGPNNNNRAVFGVRGSGGTVFVDLVHCSTGVNVALEPPALTALADAVERFVPPAVPRRTEVVAQLRAQAAFLAGGGRPQDSPLAPMATASLVKAATNAESVFTMLA
ncbi:hypothetical protein [Microbacterium gorillae]|uniref:hypothetical protein n=1 Tax=Microbacterium gorillae TaxID=1231063 RepID=UPI00058AF85F|nr:hypothetical protein [Microbacterium gorillae]